MNSNNFVYANIEMCTSYSNTLKSFTYLERELLYKFDENHFVRLSDIKNKFSLLKYYLYIKANKELKDVILNTSPSGFGLYINKNTLQNAFLEYDEFVNIKTLKKIQLFYFNYIYILQKYHLNILDNISN